MKGVQATLWTIEVFGRVSEGEIFIGLSLIDSRIDNHNTFIGQRAFRDRQPRTNWTPVRYSA